MKRPQDSAEWLLLLVAIITVLSGLLQILIPAEALALSGINAAADSIYLLRLSSLLTALFGGMLLHSFLAGKQEPSVYLWAGLQKLLAAALVMLGLISGKLTARVLPIALYDTAAGLFLFWYLYNRLMQRS